MMFDTHQECEENLRKERETNENTQKYFNFRYFKNSQGENKEHIYKWWHRKLADFFENVTNLSRKLEVRL